MSDQANDLDEIGDVGEPEADGLWGALLRAQATFPTIVRGKTAKVKTRGDGEYSYDYADLGDILREVGPVLRANGLILTQPIVSTPDGAAIRTTLVHAPSGEKEISDFPLPMDGAGAQQVGSLITYWRRYSAQAILGITTESDSDAQDVDVPRRGSSRARPTTSRSGSGGSGAARTSGPSLGVLWEDLKNLASTLDAGREEWEHWKLDNDWARVMAADDGKLVESKRQKIEDALRVVKEIRANELAAKGEEPWGEGPGESDPVTGTDWEGDGPYG